MARQMDDLVIHEFHLNDATDPDSWSTFRGAWPAHRAYTGPRRPFVFCARRKNPLVRLTSTGPACLCNFPPCKNRPGKPDQTRCGAAASCDNQGPDCSIVPADSRAYWNSGPCFPTSELTLIPEDDKLSLYYRGFDGGYYKSQQVTAGDVGGKFGPYDRLGGDDDPNATIE